MWGMNRIFGSTSNLIQLKGIEAYKSLEQINPPTSYYVLLKEFLYHPRNITEIHKQIF